MLCSFLLYSKVNLLYKCAYPLFSRFFFLIGQYRILRRAPCPTRGRSLAGIYFTYSTVHMSIWISQLIPAPSSCVVTISFVSTSFFFFLAKSWSLWGLSPLIFYLPLFFLSLILNTHMAFWPCAVRFGVLGFRWCENLTFHLLTQDSEESSHSLLWNKQLSSFQIEFHDSIRLSSWQWAP